MNPQPALPTASPSDTLNILDFEPTLLEGDDLDITSSLKLALKAVPEAKAFLSDRTEHAATIMFPSLRDQAAYVLRAPVDVPSNRNVRLAATSPYGARIELREEPGGGPAAERHLRPALRSLGGRRAHVFENLIFRGGGVTIGQTNRTTLGMTEFRSCLFTDIMNPDAKDCAEEAEEDEEQQEAVEEQRERGLKWAISTAGPGVVGVRVSNCEFAQTDHGVGVLHNGCDNWIIGDNSRFVRMRGVGVEIRSSGVTVRDARFEDKLSGAGCRPYIRVRGTGPFDGGLSEIVGCRFGGEVGMEPGTDKELDGPPRHVIELGPNRLTEHENAPLVGVVISRNRFLGRTRSTTAAAHNRAGGPTKDSAANAISLRSPVRHTIVAENHFRRYFDALIEETPKSLAIDPTSPSGLKSHSNLFVGNAVERQVTPNRRPYQGLFSGDDKSWQSWPPGQDEPL